MKTIQSVDKAMLILNYIADHNGKATLSQISRGLGMAVTTLHGFISTLERWNLIQKHYIDALKLEVTPEEATEEAKKMAAAQFAYYGIPNVDGETLANYAKNILGNKEENRKVYEKLFENKVIDAVISQITVSEKAISAEDFGKLVQDAQ